MLPTAFLVTRGFGDILRIGYQDRPHLFALQIQKRDPLYELVAEIDERLRADGSVERSLDHRCVREVLQQLKERGIVSLAICFLHSYRNPRHEREVARLAYEVGFREISTSSELAPLIKLVSRAETTVVDAYLSPVVVCVPSRPRSSTIGNEDASTLHVMTSYGGLVDQRTYRGKDSVLSGPAGGAVVLTDIARAVGLPRIIGLDMGGDEYRCMPHRQDAHR